MIEFFRYWLASKILCKKIYNLEDCKAEWIKEHLKEGGHVQLKYEVHTVQ